MVRWELTETIALAKFKATCLAELQRVRTTGQTVRIGRCPRRPQPPSICSLRNEPAARLNHPD